MMADLSTTHATFSFERLCQAPPDRVFSAFANPQEKMRWQDSPDALPVEGSGDSDYLEFDFRVGGHERFAFEVNGVSYAYDAEYFDIISNRRIVYRYAMIADGRPDSISNVTVGLAPNGGGTALTYTEQGTFLDGIDDPQEREAGISDLLDNLVKYVAQS